MYDECVIQLLVPQVYSLIGMGFQPRSQINNHFVTSKNFYIDCTQYVDFLPLDLLQQLKWGCGVRELWGNMR